MGVDKISLTFNLSEKLCEDEVIGILEYDESKKEYKLKYHSKFDKKIIRNEQEYKLEYNVSNYKKLVVILESPHIDEFKCDLGNRPANGRTGSIFKDKFDRIINNEYSSNLKPHNYLIFLVNSIQYQCSLGVPTDAFRDYVWLELWNRKEIRDDFITRINNINPDIIINCCTKGKNKINCDSKDCIYLKDRSEANITQKLIKKVGYNLNKDNDKITIFDKRGLIVLDINNGEDIELKKFVKYQIEKKCGFTQNSNNYFELLHPINWDRRYK